ncbi:2-succinyl-5-enolpyruvyl-6-hydroxy-3-cyclohexene-1-carboxylic-acid synthase [Aestuariirhabdus litorea]|uniref:2-succinyl-5-enolpyruvyl-6-hydroxy-3-cyclohexene-1-carboxylate synthase n=1 Tax=Aestuariirhabdus litorea TaxID=2528527 RepID=A0A3P3VKX9_9GAMM|nr:2-succinyl-5-enolpyruvyl-6-hydroxy-3-cyclohexene-1-carboxylic-acid synthase [Aestuariirhabdus litorea]RRJ82528.1 2-succinyl-5-enolpyruvyl-6-hydroxy-3-cyclohexene-1-carboxylic-acid synthase [Aestuariirhabdus litorea]RWW92689.1 2-succinyl-5-enolpyruvyl-6-hydroxy-3-cyclohexene-1-carboxylic-acid synthase [Endozoicomonadaceae bacterium GTF-13]
MFPVVHRSPNELQAALILEELVRHGVTDLCLAPGSRSAPLVFAADAHPHLRLHHHFDERGLGFLALGLSKAQQRPVALLTTSGSAVANLYPAVIEAAQSAVPLILLTADRPPRLHDCGANQAINQIDIFAGYPTHSIYLPPPDAGFSPASLLHQLAPALAAQHAFGGVVQINCMFDEPLYPSGAALDFSAALTPLGGWLSEPTPWPAPVGQSTTPLPTRAEWESFCTAPGVVVAGRLDDNQQAQAVAHLARALGWPLLGDIQSQLRSEPDSLKHSDLLLCQHQAQSTLAPLRQLLMFGDRLVSKRLQQWLDSHPWEQFWLVHPGDSPRAPGRNQHRFFASTALPWCQALPPPNAPANGLRATLADLDTRIAEGLAQHFHSTLPDAPLSEPSLAHRLCRLLPDAHQLFAGNSLSIRLLDQLSGPLPADLKVLANRGASGIDGLLATAAGAACAHPGGTTLLIGDTSLLYDLNSLALLRGELALVVVVLNNDGGAIFNTLPIEDSALRERHFRCPHRMQFEQACAQFAVAYRRVDRLTPFEQEYRAALARTTPTLIEISCDGEETAAQLRRLTTPDTLTHFQ